MSAITIGSALAELASSVQRAEKTIEQALVEAQGLGQAREAPRYSCSRLCPTCAEFINAALSHSHEPTRTATALEHTAAALEHTAAALERTAAALERHSLSTSKTLVFPETATRG
jgi:phage shock protein A